MSAKQCCEMILKDVPNCGISSERLQEVIELRGGKRYKVSNIERRCRESESISSKRVPNKNYNHYMWNSQQDD
jgi:hypothetical protein